MRKLVLLCSRTERPRLMRADDLQPILDRDKNVCIMISERDMQIAAITGGAVVSLGELSRAPEKNEESHYQALALGAVCMKHDTFISDIFVNGLVVEALKTAIYGSCTAYAMQLGERLNNEQMSELAKDVFDRAAAFVDCPCVAEHRAIVANFEQEERHHRQQLN